MIHLSAVVKTEDSEDGDFPLGVPFEGRMEIDANAEVVQGVTRIGDCRECDVFRWGGLHGDVTGWLTS